MRLLAIRTLLSFCVVGSVACHDDDAPQTDTTDVEVGMTNAPARVAQLAPPLDLQKPPKDASRTASGLRYKTVVANHAGSHPKPDETALIHYTGWIQRTGATFFTTRGRNEAIAMDLAHVAPAFAEVLPLVREGERIVLWVPPSQGSAEAMVYEIEMVGIRSSRAAASARR